MEYVLPFNHGQQGYRHGIKQTNNTKNVTCMQYYSYHIQIRDLEKITINNFGRLFQQYVVDMYAKVELQRLLFFKTEIGQKKIRAELYCGLTDLLHGQSIRTLCTTGKRFILPSSFHGSPRNMHQLYQDSMALIRKYGKPDLFITFTCNSNWHEICELKFKLGNHLIYRFICLFLY
jgi:hypothetical protein